MKEYWAIVNKPNSMPMGIKITQMKMEFMERVVADPNLREVIGIPIYFSPGFGVWPKPSVDCIVVQKIKEEEI